MLPREDEEKEENGDEEEHASAATPIVDRSFADDEDALRAARPRRRRRRTGGARDRVSVDVFHETPRWSVPGREEPRRGGRDLVAALRVAHNLLSSGVAPVLRRGARRRRDVFVRGAGRALGARHLRAWSARPSWRAVMRAEDTVTARRTSPWWTRAAPDSLRARDMLKCMDRARAGDTYYARAVARFGATLPRSGPPRTHAARPGARHHVAPRGHRGGQDAGRAQGRARARREAARRQGGTAAAPAASAPPAKAAPPPPTPIARWLRPRRR